MDYNTVKNNLLNRFSKNELKIFDLINPFDTLHLASMGHNDTEGYQIFTPQFIVEDMCAAVGDDIFDFSKTVLEPTSGDGAFTVYIFQKRLEKALNGNNFEIDSLKALSTIYSIEMDKELIEKQRCNILTAAILFFKKHNIEIDEHYFDVLKCIITNNFMWAMFNSDNPLDNLWGADVIYKMPEASKGNFKPLDIPVWDIDENNIDYHMEGVDLW